jgi:hypothetical protein
MQEVLAMSFSAIIPAAGAQAANAALEAQGYGPDNFSILLRTDTGQGDGATHVGLNMLAVVPAYRAAVAALPDVSISDVPFPSVGFVAHVQAEALEWSDPANWTENPVMTGDQRTFDGKLWVSLVDFNVWQPPVNWREVVTDGYPAWVQPTGAVDAYPLGFRVAHSGQNWESNTPANVWEPGVFGWDALQDG